jgi:hypothetical protein
MDSECSSKVKTLSARLQEFMHAHIYPNEQRYCTERATGVRWRPPMPTRASCALRAVPTKCTATRSVYWSWPNMREALARRDRLR